MAVHARTWRVLAAVVGMTATAALVLGLSHRTSRPAGGGVADTATVTARTTASASSSPVPLATGAAAAPTTSTAFSMPGLPDLVARHFAPDRCASTQGVELEVVPTLDNALRLTDAVLLVTAGESHPGKDDGGPYPRVLTDLTVDEVLWDKKRVPVPSTLVADLLGSANSDGTFTCYGPIPIPGQRYAIFLAEYNGAWKLTWSGWGLFVLEPTGILDVFNPTGGFSHELDLSSAAAMAESLSRHPVTEDGWANDRATTAPAAALSPMPPSTSHG